MFFHLLYISGCKVTTFFANGKNEVEMLFHLIPYKKSNPWHRCISLKYNFYKDGAS